MYLTRAEALNELDGPNQESINLINDLRYRAFTDSSKLVDVSDFADKAALREHILAERGWELYAEGYRRDDLIRQGVYISRAIARGVQNITDDNILYPIPQSELDKNGNLEQNDGYEN